MWVLMNSCQFIVYISMWQFSIPIIAKLFFEQLKRVAFGEFIDDLEVGDKVCEALGLYDNEDNDSED